MTISETLQRTISRGGFQLQKYSPQILTAVGIAGLLTAGVLAAKSTLKLEKTLDDANHRLEDVKQAREDGSATQKDVNKAVVRNTTDLVKLYWQPVTLAAGSAVLILVGHNILHKRNVALIAAYKGLEEAFNTYRARVIEEFGEEKDEQFRRGFREIVTEDEKGKKVKTLAVDPSNGEYLFDFGPNNWYWEGNPDTNMFYVTRFEQIYNEKLRAHGVVFLNDVLKSLGIPVTKAGAVTGWVYDKGTGDDYISFGIKDLQASHGYIQLEFNVDGVILDYI